MTTPMKVGIDRLHFYAPQYHFELESLALLRGLAKDAFTRGITQKRMAIIPPDEDIVTMAANAAAPIIAEGHQIDMLLFATESSFDLSKASGIYVHHLLQLPTHCRVFEVKQACYGATAALQMACDHIRSKPEAKVLILASDIAKYAPNTPAEASQGAGAAAILVTANPSILSLSPNSGYLVEDHMDFWRPPYLQHALVDGRLSCELYLQLLEKSWKVYSQASGLSYSDHQHFCYHTPVPKLAERAHKWLARKNQHPLTPTEVSEDCKKTLYYNRQIGNTYTASLYIALLSLIENTAEDLAGQRVGLYSYGSGCMAEFFSGVLEPQYQKVLKPSLNHAHLAASVSLDTNQYLAWVNEIPPKEGGIYQPKNTSKSPFRLTKIEGHIRHYERQLETAITPNEKLAHEA